MKRITFLRKATPPEAQQGYLFEFMGLRLVVYKPYDNLKWWRVAEYSTGYALGPHMQTRNQTYAAVRAYLAQKGSLQICQAMTTAIGWEDGKLLNV